MVKLLILGTGSMAVSHATNFQAAPDTELVAAVETDAARREAFGKQFGIENLFADLESAIAWGEFDAVANVTPDAVHYPTTMRLIAAGKHVFCEKPLATSYPLALEMADDRFEFGQRLLEGEAGDRGGRFGHEGSPQLTRLFSVIGGREASGRQARPQARPQALPQARHGWMRGSPRGYARAVAQSRDGDRWIGL